MRKSRIGGDPPVILTGPPSGHFDRSRNHAEKSIPLHLGDNLVDSCAVGHVERDALVGLESMVRFRSHVEQVQVGCQALRRHATKCRHKTHRFELAQRPARRRGALPRLLTQRLLVVPAVALIVCGVRQCKQNKQRSIVREGFQAPYPARDLDAHRPSLPFSARKSRRQVSRVLRESVHASRSPMMSAVRAFVSAAMH